MEIHTELADGTRLLGVHASPGRDGGAGITPDRPEADLGAALAGLDVDIVCAGHTHQPTDRRVGGIRAVNLGSVGNPITDDLRASYVIVHHDRHGHHLERRRVSYDHDEFLARLSRSGHPEIEHIASFQRGPQIRHPSRRYGAPEPQRLSYPWTDREVRAPGLDAPVVRSGDESGAARWISTCAPGSEAHGQNRWSAAGVKAAGSGCPDRPRARSSSASRQRSTCSTPSWPASASP
ncbi:hypothetical protein BH23ACT2_BH23ACT2_10540 [soil metagenome]